MGTWILILQLQTYAYAGTNEIHSIEFISEKRCEAARVKWLNSQRTRLQEPPFEKPKMVYTYGYPTAICVKK